MKKLTPKKDKKIWAFVIWLTLLLIWGYLVTNPSNVMQVAYLIMANIIYFIFIYKEAFEIK